MNVTSTNAASLRASAMGSHAQRQAVCSISRVLQCKQLTTRSHIYIKNNVYPLPSQVANSQCRQYSTPPITPASPPPRTLRSQIDPAPPPPPNASKPRRRIGTILIAAGFLMLGLTAGQWMRYVIAPPELPLPGTKTDEQLSAYIRAQAQKLPIVQSLEQDPEWKAWNAYESFEGEDRKHRITTGPLSGSRGIGAFQRIYKNLITGEVVSVIWIGGALQGFPGVCHGGLIATILDESLGRCAISRFPSKTGVTANLELNYLAPVLTNSFYVIKTVPVEEGHTDRKAWISARWEGLDGRVHVEAKGLFVVPKKVQLREIKDNF